jgi:hypothetical protein
MYLNYVVAKKNRRSHGLDGTNLDVPTIYRQSEPPDYQEAKDNGVYYTEVRVEN